MSKRWSDSEIKLLKQNLDKSASEIISLLPGRTVPALRQVVANLRVSVTGGKHRNRKDTIEGQTFGSLTATGRNKYEKDSGFAEVKCSHGGVNFVKASSLRSGRTAGCMGWGKKCPVFFLRRSSELASVKKHYFDIFSPNSVQQNYKGMPFHDEWNPNKGGSFLSGSLWIVEHLGRRPNGCSLHIVDHAKGFVPGNLEWTGRKKQNSEQMFKIIARLRHENKTLKCQLIEAQQVLALA